MMLEATDIAVSYGLRPVLRGLNLAVQAREFTALLGANGAGKTTLLRVLATLLKPERGALRIDGMDALAHPARARSRIGVVLHAPMVYGDLTARENLHFHARLHRLNTATATRVVDEWLERVGLIRRANERARRFSRGMLQRLSVARAMLHQPALLLLDEPYTGLDSDSADQLNALLVAFASAGGAVLMSTHETGRGMQGVTGVVRIEGGRTE